MHRATRLLLPLICMFAAAPLLAQMPFYTDNADVTDQGTLHFESFNEYDGLQSAQYPDLRQNTSNFKVQLRLPPWPRTRPRLSLSRHLPRARIARPPSDSAMPILGIKWNFHKANRPLSAPALSASLYIEFPTGDAEPGTWLRPDRLLAQLHRAGTPLRQDPAQRQLWISVRRQHQHRRTRHTNYPRPCLHRRTLPGSTTSRRVSPSAPKLYGCDRRQQRPGQRPAPGARRRRMPAQQAA